MPSPAGAPAIPSGWEALDWVLGTGGFARGRITEVFGPEACGKTSIALRAAAEAQKAGGSAAYIDADFALDAQRARGLAAGMDRLLLVRPESGEQALEIAARLTASRAIDLLVIDSVAALAPRLELESGLTAALGALHSRLMAQALRKLAASARRTETCLLFLNQVRTRPGLAAGEAETTAGGYSVRLYAAVRVELRPVPPAGSRRIRARTVKNKLAPPFRAAEFELAAP